MENQIPKPEEAQPKGKKAPKPPKEDDKRKLTSLLNLAKARQTRLAQIEKEKVEQARTIEAPDEDSESSEDEIIIKTSNRRPRKTPDPPVNLADPNQLFVQQGKLTEAINKLNLSLELTKPKRKPKAPKQPPTTPVEKPVPKVERQETPTPPPQQMAQRVSFELNPAIRNLLNGVKTKPVQY